MPRTRGILARRAFVELFADDSELVSGLHRASRGLRSFGKKVMGLGMRMAAGSVAMGAPFATGI